MASTPVHANTGQTGRGTLTLSLYPQGSDTIANGAGDTASEQTNRKGVYVFTVTEALTGLHYAKVTDSGGGLIGSWLVNLTDTTTVHSVGDEAMPANLPVLSIESDGDLTKVNTLDGHTAQTGDTFSQLPTNFSATAIDGSGHVEADVVEIAGTAQRATDLANYMQAMVQRQNTSQAGSSTTVTLDASASSSDDHYNCNIIVLLTLGQWGIIEDYNGTTKVATVDPIGDFAPSGGGGDDFLIIRTGMTHVSATQTLPEAYAAAGSTMTMPQALYYIVQHLRERGISGTTETIKKLDGSTTAATNTLDDATNPTSVTAAT